MCVRVAGVEEEAQPRGRVRHGGVDDGLDVHATPAHPVGQQQCAGRRAGEDGYDGCRARSGVEPCLGGAPAEQLRVGPQPRHPFRLGSQPAECGQRGPGGGRRQAHAVDEARRGVPQVLDEPGLAGDVTAAAGEGLGQGAHQDVHVPRPDGPVLHGTAAGRAQHPEAVRLVEVEQEAVPAPELDQAGQIGQVAVHAVHAFHGHQHPGMPGRQPAQEPVERGKVVMRERLAPGPGQPDALQDAVVGEFVVQREVALAQQLADYPEVGGMTAHQGECRLGAQQPGDGCLQLTVQRALSGGDPARRHRRPVPGYGLGGGGDDRRMAGQPQIVVAGEVQQDGAADPGGCPERAFVGHEVRIRYAEPPGERQAFGEGRDLGERVAGCSGRRHSRPCVQVARQPCAEIGDRGGRPHQVLWQAIEVRVRPGEVLLQLHQHERVEAEVVDEGTVRPQRLGRVCADFGDRGEQR